MYIYTYSFLILSPIAFRLLIRANTALLPKNAVSALPGILWPSLWKVNNASSDRPQALLKVDGIVASTMHHTAVCLTFGLTCPVLAIVIAIAVILSSIQWTLVINRFVFNRLLVLGLFGERSQINVKTSMVKNYLANRRDKNDKALSDCDNIPMRSGAFVLDETLLREMDLTCSISGLEKTLSDASVGLRECLWPVLVSASIFVAFISWDMAGDQVYDITLLNDCLFYFIFLFVFYFF